MMYIYNPLSSVRSCPKCTGQYDVVDYQSSVNICKCKCGYQFKAYPSNKAPINAPLSSVYVLDNY